MIWRKMRVAVRWMSTMKAQGNRAPSPSLLHEPQEITDYDHFLNKMAKRRRPSVLREISHVISNMPPETISFAVGAPSTTMFPFREIIVGLKDQSSIHLKGKELSIALQYLPSRGYGPLVRALQEFQERIHGEIDWRKKSVLVTAGGQEALSNTIEMTMEEGDSIVVQNPVYPAVADLVRPFRPNYIPIEQDHEGMKPELLHSALEKCIEQNIPLPKVIYFNPMGCNPTGMCLSNNRKKILYELASRYNLIILEDDSYYFLHYSNEEPISFLSLDTEGRVLRFDSFSKILSSGLRIGFVTGPEPLLRKMELHLQVSTLHTSALSQVILHKLFETWGNEKLLRHFYEVREYYRMKRDQMISAVKKHLDGLVEWHTPTGGMFLWLKVKGIGDSYNLAMKRCIENRLVVIPGHPFVSLEQSEPCPYIRLSFSMASPQQMDQGCAILATIIRDEQEKHLRI